MKICDSPSAIKTIRCLIGQADLYRQKGRLLKAAKILKKADALLKATLRKSPGNKSLLLLRTKHEKCWNKIIETMAKNI